MFLSRGFEFTHEAVRDWQVGCARLLSEQASNCVPGVEAKSAARGMLMKRTSKLADIGATSSGPLIEMATWQPGNLVDAMLSEHRDMDMEAAKRLFTEAKEVVGHKPTRVAMDGHDSYPRAIRRILGRKVVGKCSTAPAAI